ncbi:hypothetical protein DYB31_008467, partial [Aphanomyces astaci]
MPLFSRSVRNVYGWLTWITSSLLPFNFCENEMARRYSNLGPISNKTLMKWMHQMCRWLEAKLKKTPSESFACVFDAWTCGSTHYVAVFASFPSDSLRGYEKVLLALSPINDEDSLTGKIVMELLIAQLTDLNSVTLALQDESLTLADVRMLFDEVVVQYPGAEV